MLKKPKILKIGKNNKFSPNSERVGYGSIKACCLYYCRNLRESFYN